MKREYKDYSHYLRAKGIKPIVIERTAKQSGDLVIINSVKIEAVA